MSGLGQRDVDAYLSLFSVDSVFSDGTEEISGRPSWAEVVRRNCERFSPVSWDIHEIAVDGSKIQAEWTATIVPTGMASSVSTRGMSITETRDGLFVSHREYRWSPQ